mgnify:CR=1 FL=1
MPDKLFSSAGVKIVPEGSENNDVKRVFPGHLLC